MKNLKFSFLLAIALIAFTASLRAEFLYVSYGKGLLSFSINPNTGALTKLPGTPTLFAEGTGSLALTHIGKLLYLSTGGNVVSSGYSYGPYSSIHGYRIAGNGQLISLPGSPYKVDGGYLAVDPFNRFLYAANYGTYPNPGSVAVYRIEPNGSLKAVPGSPFLAGVGAYQIAVDPFGRFIYVVNFSSKNLSVYQVLENGALTQVPGSPFSGSTPYGNGFLGNDPISVVADPNGRFVYVANENLSNIASYRVGSNGALSQLPGSPTPFNGAWYENMATDPFGNYLYVDEGTSGFVVYHINLTTGLPEVIQGFSIGNMEDNNPVGVCVSRDREFVYEGSANGLVDPGPMTLRGFKVGPTSLLTLVPGSPYYPLGNNLDPAEVEATEGWPSSMVVAP
jgi:6-phosphogluconolactonase (cycloisomerase 2 family)